MKTRPKSSWEDRAESAESALAVERLRASEALNDALLNGTNAMLAAHAEIARLASQLEGLQAEKIDMCFRAGQLLGREFDGASLEDVAKEVVRLRSQLAGVRELVTKLRVPYVRAIDGKVPDYDLGNDIRAEVADRIEAALPAVQAQPETDSK